MSSPLRIQRRRTCGWRMPEGAVYVGRRTKWGNPFAPGMDQELRFSGVKIRPDDEANPDGLWAWRHMPISLDTAIALYRDALQVIDSPLYEQPLDVTVDDVRRELAGLDLACYCALDQPCHADVLLEVANR